MNDPWKHIRADLARGMDIGDLHKVDIEQLMADADALLDANVTMGAFISEVWIKGSANPLAHETWRPALETYAALPDHLKGE